MRIFDRVFGAVVNFSKRGGEISPLQLGEGIGDQHRLHESLGHTDIKKRPLLLFASHLDEALLFIEEHVREGTDGDLKRWIF